MVLMRIVQLALFTLCCGPASILAASNIEFTGQPSDAVDITVDEGTWMSVDVSPDGKTLVFDLLGDLYLLPATGGEATPLRQGAAMDRIPRFSPDGTRIAFVGDAGGYDNLWVVNADGSDAREVSRETESWVTLPVWTADGKHVVARRLSVEGYKAPHPFGRELWLYDVEGGLGRKLIETPNASNEPSLSRDGRWLYHTEDITPLSFDKKGPDGANLVITRRDLDAVDDSSILVSGFGGAFAPQISPDGNTLAFVRRVATRNVLFAYDMAAGIQRPVFDGLSRDIKVHPASDGFYPSFAWFPDNRHVAIWAKGALLKVDMVAGEVERIPFTAKARHVITQAIRIPQDLSGERFKARAIGLPAVSPDGDTVVFGAVGSIWKKSLPDGDIQRLTAADEYAHSPSFLPNGRDILYVNWNDETGSSLKLRRMAGKGTKTLLAIDAIVAHVSRSSDGGKIAFQVDKPSPQLGGYHVRPGIYWVPIEGGVPNFVTAEGFEPVFSESGERLYFNLVNQGPERISVLKSIALDGSGVREHIRSADAHHFRLSPDGSWVAFQQNFALHVAPYAETGHAMDLSATTGSPGVRKLGGSHGTHHHWSDGGKTLHWLAGIKYLSTSMADVPQAESTILASHEFELAPEVARDIPEGLIAFTGATIITMNGDEVVENGTLLVERDHIVAVGPEGSVDFPRGTRVYDVAGKTIMPGLVDAHDHMALGKVPNAIAPQQYSRFYARLAFGVTTAFDPYAPSEFIFRLAEMVKAGRMVGPRIFSTGNAALGFPGGPLLDTKVTSLEVATDHVLRLKEAGAIAVKSYIQPGRIQRQQLARAARDLGMMIVPEGEGHFYHDLSMILDGYTTVEHNLPVELFDDVVQLFSHSQTASTPTLMVLQAELNGMQYFYQSERIWEMEKLRRFTPVAKGHDRAQKPLWAHMRTLSAPEEIYEIGTRAIARSLKKLNDAGVLINLGSHGEIDGIGATWELWLIHQGGMSNHDTLRAGTINGARTLGFDRHIGSLEPGKLADLIVLDADPLEDIGALNSVRYTMVNGRLYDALSMDEIGNHKEPRGKFYWEVNPNPDIDWNESMIGEVPYGPGGNLHD